MENYPIIMKKEKNNKRYKLFLFSRTIDINILILALLSWTHDIHSFYFLSVFIFISILSIISWIERQKIILFLESKTSSECHKIFFLKYYFFKLIFVNEVQSNLYLGYNLMFFVIKFYLINTKKSSKQVIREIIFSAFFDLMIYYEADIIFISYNYIIFILISFFILKNVYENSQDLRKIKEYLELIPLPSFMFDQLFNIVKENNEFLLMKSNPKYNSLVLNIKEIQKNFVSKLADSVIDNSFASIFDKFEIKLSNLNELYDNKRPSSKSRIVNQYKTIKSYESLKKELSNYFQKPDKINRNQFYIAVLFPKQVKEKEILKTCESQKISLLRTVSHELRTPINGMHGSLSIMKSMIPSCIIQYYTIAEVCTIILLNTVNCMVDYTSIISGIFKVNKTIFNIYEIQNYLRNIFDVKAKLAKIDFQIKINFQNSDQNMIINSDYERIKQVLIQLLQNAFNITLEGFVHLNIMINCNEGNLEFSITDSGLGLTDDQIRHIVSKSSSTIDNTKYLAKAVSSQNLGLQTSALILEKLNSKLAISSEIGKGTNYYFTLKVEFQQEKQEESPKFLKYNQASKNLKMKRQPSTFNVNQLKSMKFLKKHGCSESIPKPNNSIIQKVIQKIPEEIKEESKDINNEECSPSNYNQSVNEQVEAFAFINNLSKGYIMHTKSNFALMKSCSSKKVDITSREEHKSVIFPNFMYPIKKSYKILIVDDEPFNRLVLESMIKKNPEIDTIEASNGKKAIEVIIESCEEINLIFMDIGMPIMDGYTATREIKKICLKRKANIPIIALTSFSSDTDKVKSFEAGMSEFLNKPISYEQLVKVIDKYIYHKKDKICSVIN